MLQSVSTADKTALLKNRRLEHFCFERYDKNCLTNLKVFVRPSETLWKPNA